MFGYRSATEPPNNALSFSRIDARRATSKRVVYENHRAIL